MSSNITLKKGQSHYLLVLYGIFCMYVLCKIFRISLRTKVKILKMPGSKKKSKKTLKISYCLNFSKNLKIQNWCLRVNLWKFYTEKVRLIFFSNYMQSNTSSALDNAYCACTRVLRIRYHNKWCIYYIYFTRSKIVIEWSEKAELFVYICIFRLINQIFFFVRIFYWNALLNWIFFFRVKFS